MSPAEAVSLESVTPRSIKVADLQKRGEFTTIPESEYATYQVASMKQRVIWRCEDAGIPENAIVFSEVEKSDMGESLPWVINPDYAEKNPEAVERLSQSLSNPVL